MESKRELIERMIKALPQDGLLEPLPGVRLARASQPTDRIFGVTHPSVCVIAQGAKEVSVGDSLYRYDAQHYLIATMELPITGKVVEASKDHPYLSLRVDLDPSVVASVIVESGLPVPQNHAHAKAVYVSSLDTDLLGAIVRLSRLIESPTEARVLMPLVKREIVFRLLMGDQGNRLLHLPMLGGQSHQIAKAVERLRENFDKPLRIDNLAKDLGMSSSGLHHHFKAVMDMSPLQFQKLIRLQEARRLMLGESFDAASAGYHVGYEDASHFSRDYKKHFGDSPVRDVERLRSMVTAD